MRIWDMVETITIRIQAKLTQAFYLLDSKDGTMVVMMSVSSPIAPVWTGCPLHPYTAILRSP